MVDLINNYRIISTDKTLTQLQQQIELNAKINNYNFINEIAVDIFIKNVIGEENGTKNYNKKYRNHINSLLSYLVYLFESNVDPNKLWLIHRAILKFVNSIDERKCLEEIISSADLLQKIFLYADPDFINLSMICSLKLTNLVPHATEFYKKIQKEAISEENEILQSLCIRLKNSLLTDSLNTSFVLNILSKQYQKTQTKNIGDKINILDKIYSNGLIYALKNQNRHLVIDILLRSPDSIFADENLVKQLIEFLRTSFSNDKSNPDSDLMNIYSYSLFCSSKKLIKLISTTRGKTFSNNTENFFDLKQCFLLAVYEKKHFLDEFINFYYTNPIDSDLSMLPIKSQIIISFLSFYNIINNHEDFSRNQEKISKLESNLFKLFTEFEPNGDRIFSQIVQKIQFIFKFSDWCCKQDNNEKINFRYEIIAQLMSGCSPLKILSNNGFMKIRNLNSLKEDYHCDYLCDLFSIFDRNVTTILKGFIIIRLIICLIFSSDKQNIHFDTNKLQNLLRDIEPIDFRLEIMENLFSLLFITKYDFKNDRPLNSDDEGYLDESMEKITDPTKKKKPSNNYSQVENFICPNWLIPKLLDVLKDMLYKTNTDLFSKNYSEENTDDKFGSNLNANLDKLKSRINTLLKYVCDAQFRYDVIRPAFNCANSNYLQDSVHSYYQPGLISTNTDQYSNNCAISSSNDTDNNNYYNRNTSLISCMLASHEQLLCYTLTKNRLESSRQIVKLFENDLKTTKPYKELQLLDYFSEFHNQVCKVNSMFTEPFSNQRSINNKDKNNTSNAQLKINEITSLGIHSSRIQSLLYETLIKMESIELDTKIIFMLDYALSTCPSLALSQSILESVFIHNQNLFIQTNNKLKNIISDKIEYFVLDVQKMIKNLGQHIDIGNVSMVEYLEKSLTLPSLLDGQAFVNTFNTRIEMCRWYFKFYTMLVDLETQINDDPNLILEHNLKQSDLENKSKQLNYYYEQLMNHCPVGKYQYLKALSFYVSKMNKALEECSKRNIYNEKSTMDTSIICSQSSFSILKQSLSAILCSMVIKSKMSPKIIDDLAQIMKVNLIGVLCSVFCPIIPSTFLPDSKIDFTINELCQPSISKLIETYFQTELNYRDRVDSQNFVDNYFSEENNFDSTDSLMNNSFQPSINQDVLNYFHGKCSILVDILQLLNLIDETQISMINSSNTTLKLLPNSPLANWIELIKKNFYCGDLGSTLILAFYPRIPAGQNIVIKTLEHHTSNKNYLKVNQLFQYIEDFSLLNSQNEFSINDNVQDRYQIFQNAIYSHLAFVKEHYLFQIERDPKMKTHLILNLLYSVKIYEETFYATRLIRLGLQSIQDDAKTHGMDISECKTELEKNLKEIEFYASIGQLTGLKTWKLAKDNLQSIDVLTIIKTKKRYLLAIDWFELFGFENDTSDLLIELLIYAYSEMNEHVALKRLFQMFLEKPKFNDVIIIIEKILSQAENLELRTFLIDFLIKYYRKRQNNFMMDQYEQQKLGVEMVKLLSRKIQSDYLDLIPAPLILIEQLLMNSEFESLEKIIKKYKLFKADSLIEKYAQKSVYIELYDSFDGSDLTVISSESSLQTMNKSLFQFVVPSKVPSKDQWVSDTEKTHCMLCQLVRFSMINRRHHCRRCGRVVCNGCSLNNILIAEINSNIPVRVCDDCYNWHMNNHETNIQTTNLSPVQTVLKRTNWRLSLTESLNHNRRNDFAYESAPSVSLCLAILRLHSDKTKCCKFIIDKICAPLIESISSRNVDSTLLIEMIRSLLISTRLTFEEDTNQSEDFSTEIEQLNLYLDRLDVIRMLINANYGHKEMVEYVLNNNIQKLQEKLLEAERFELTIDIAKKYGIESTPIWKSWALICLKYFHFVEARQKFIRYFDLVNRFSEIQNTLKMIVETLVSINYINSNSVSLKDKCSKIIFGEFDFLNAEISTNAATSSSSGVGAILNQGSTFIKTNQKKLTQQHYLTPRILQEIVYYLETYGTKDDQIHFYVEHFYWKEAIDCFLKSYRNNMSVDQSIIFLQKIFIPAQMNGQLSEMFAAITLCDPQQSLLWSYLISICRYLNRNNYYHSLYRLQVFMNDYLRAAITLINHFFLDPTPVEPNEAINFNNFSLLFSRLVHLEKARDYCNKYLHNIEYLKMKQGCLVVDKKDVFKQIRLIELQMEVLKRFKLMSYPITVRINNVEELKYYLTEWPITDKPLFLSAYALCLLEEKLSIKIGRLPFPPTLLEHDSKRKSLITAFIILYFSEKDDNIEDGFRCAFRIIQDHHLDTELVYKCATIFLIANYLERNLNVERISNDLKQLLTCIHHSTGSSGASNLNESNEPDQKTRTINKTAMASPLMTDIDKLSDDIIDTCLCFTETILTILKGLNQNRQNQLSLIIGLSRSKLLELKECLIKLITDDNRRIQAYLNVGKLKLAYLLAASLGQSDSIRLVLDTARKNNDQHYVKICEMWLKKNGS